ncbi:MAG: chromosome segregation protein ScpA [Sphingobacteriales bacterium]|nr:MAG: chromosome segregation protein ScpA [Sphingobacteriales bacterium]
MTYQIKLPQFEGPFDLLLFFIERDELDIYNIPISQITAEFLVYIRQLEALNIDLASEFILFVSTLMRIKARTLLPRREVDAQGQEIDPRQELIDKLLEYKRYKEASAELAQLEADRAQLFHRAAARAELHQLGETYSEGTEIQTVSLYKLVQTLERVLKRLDERLNKPQHVVVKYNWSQEGQRTWLLTHLEAEHETSFEALFGHCQSRIHAIFTFLALLELAQQRYLTLDRSDGDRNAFAIHWNANRETQLAEEQQLAEAAVEDAEVSGTPAVILTDPEI